MKLEMLNPDEVQRIHEATLLIMEKGGLWFQNCPEVVSLLRKRGCVASKGRVRFPRELVRECLGEVPDRNELRLCVTKLGFSKPLGLRPGECHVGLIGNPYYLYDHEHGERDLLEADEDDKFLLLEHLPNLEFDCCCLIKSYQRSGRASFPNYDDLDYRLEYLRRRVNSRPNGTPHGKRPIHSNILHGLEPNSRLHYPGALKPLEKMEVLRHAIVHGASATETLLAEDTPLLWCNPISPMQYHPEQVRELISVAREFGPRCFVMISPEVMCGGTGPVTLAEALTQHNAEVLGGVVLLQLLCPGMPVIYGSVTGVMDLRVADISLGNYESATINACAVQLADFYGLPSRVSAGNTSSRKPGARAMVEMALGVQMAMAAGANLITTGLLDATLMLSYEHLVLLDELIAQLKSGIMNPTLGGSAVNTALILEESHPGASFMAHEHTVANMKRAVYYSDFTGRTNKSFEEWYTLAHEKVKKILERKHDDPDAAAEVAERLSRVEQGLKEDDDTWREGDRDWWQHYVRASHEPGRQWRASGQHASRIGR